jgi:hypothetical protein
LKFLNENDNRIISREITKTQDLFASLDCTLMVDENESDDDLNMIRSNFEILNMDFG